MVGPSPYKYASFAELRAVLGPAWIVCRSCHRFVPLGRWLNRRGSRTTVVRRSASASSFIREVAR